MYCFPFQESCKFPKLPFLVLENVKEWKLICVQCLSSVFDIVCNLEPVYAAREFHFWVVDKNISRELKRFKKTFILNVILIFSCKQRFIDKWGWGGLLVIHTFYWMSLTLFFTMFRHVLKVFQGYNLINTVPV